MINKRQSLIIKIPFKTPKSDSKRKILLKTLKSYKNVGMVPEATRSHAEASPGSGET